MPLYDLAMTRSSGKVHVVRVRKTGYVDKQGRRRDYSSAYLRRTYRDGGKVKNETVANLSALPDHVIDLIDAGLKGQQLVPAAQAVTITGSLPHGHVAAVHAMAKKLGLPALLGPAGRQRDLALALVISRVVSPGSKLSTLTWWADTTLGADLGVAGASTDDIYAAMDWLAGRQDAIEAELARRHLAPEAEPGADGAVRPVQLVAGGPRCPLAARGYSRDGKKGRLQIEYGLLTDPAGRPVAVRVFPGNTGDPAAFTEIVTVVRDKFGLAKMVMVGDRGMITSARIAALNQQEDGTPRPDAYGWITALRAPAIKKLMAEDGPLQLSACSMSRTWPRSPPGTTPASGWSPAATRCWPPTGPASGRTCWPPPRSCSPPSSPGSRPGGSPAPGAIGVEVGKVISKYKTGKHFEVTITDNSLAVTRRQDQIDAEAALDGFYVLRTPVPAAELDAPAVVAAYKNLKYVERDFRHIKSDDLDLRPVFHRLEERVKAHVLICMLACYLTWHLRRAWAPLTFTDEHPPAPGNPVAPARRSAAAQAKASGQHDAAGRPYRSFRGLLEHLATLPRNQVRFAGTKATVPMLTEPTSAQREAFDLIGAPIPLTLK